MYLPATARKISFILGLTAITLSFALDHYFATDAVTPIPEPSALSLMGLGGAVAIGLSLLRNRNNKK